MIRSLLIDDEPDSIRVLKGLLQTYCPEVQILGEANGVAAALQEIEQSAPELLFLDINLITGDGFEILDRLHSVSPQVIFVTALSEHALRAFQYGAVDYLLKPVEGNDLRKAVDKAAERLRHKTPDNHLEILIDNIRALQASGQKMAIPTITGLTFVFLRDILRFEASGAYTSIILCSGEVLLSTRSVRDYETLLPPNIFLRVHSSHIVNLNKIQKYEKGRGGYLVMDDNSVIEVAIRRREDFLRQVLKP